MPLPLSITPKEEGTLLITVGPFTDDTGATVTPSAVTWTLTDVVGTVVNSRSAVSITPPASSVTILLSGDDLALSSTLRGVKRILLVRFVYTSTSGSGLVGYIEREFSIQPLVAVT